MIVKNYSNPSGNKTQVEVTL